MRNQAGRILLVFLVLVSLVVLLWGNTFLTWAFEHTLQAIVGAKVEIEGFRLNPFKFAVKMDRFQVANPADPWRNLLSAQNMVFELAPGPLFEGKTVIEEISVADLIFNDKRQTSGELKKKAARSTTEKESKLSRTIATMPILKPETITENLDLDRITGSYQFKTDQAADQIKTEFATVQQQWDVKLTELGQLQVELEKLAATISQLKKPGNLLELNEQVAYVQEIQETAGLIRTAIAETDEQFQKDRQGLTDAISRLPAAAAADYQGLLSLAQVPDLEKTNFAEALLGKEVFHASTTLLDSINYLREHLPETGNRSSKAKPKRGGQNITFPGRETVPRFLIKKIVVSGQGASDSAHEGFYAKGSITGITSEPMLYGAPTTFAFLAHTPKQTLLRMDGNLNHVTPAEFQDQLNFSMQGVPLSQLELGDSPYLPEKILAGQGQIDGVLTIKPAGLKLTTALTAAQLEMEYGHQPEPVDLIGEIVRNTLTSIEEVTLDYELVQTQEQFGMKLSSNLNQLIATSLQATLGAKVTDFTRDLQGKVDGKLGQAEKALAVTEQRFQETVTAQLDACRAPLNALEQEIQAQQSKLAAQKKELEKALETTVDTEKKKLEDHLQKEINRLKDRF